jgi:MFS transporter, DHA2 family, methylenomycin A resistance protein
MNPSPKSLLLLAWIAGFTLIDSSIVSLALPEIARELDRSIAELAWVSTGFLLALAASLLGAGRLCDRFGSRRVMIGGAAGFLATTAACGLAPVFELLLAARVLQGMAGGVLYTVSLAIAATAYPPERRASALSIYFTSGALGAVLGPVAGGLLTDLGGWRLVFFAQLPIPIAIWVMAHLLLPRAQEVRRQRFDIPGVLAASLFVLAATYALLQIPVDGGRLPALIGGLVAATALAALLFIERRAETPAVNLAIFGNVRFVVASTAGAGAWFAIMSGTVYPVIYLQMGRDFDATRSGLLLLAAPVVALLLFPFGGRIVQSLGVDRALLLGLVLLAGSAAAMVSWNGRTSEWLIVLTLLVTGAGVAITLVTSATDALSQFTPEEAGTASALFNSIRQLGAAFGVAIPAVAFEFMAAGSRVSGAALDGSTAAFVVRAGVLVIPLALVVVRWRARSPESVVPARP